MACGGRQSLFVGSVTDTTSAGVHDMSSSLPTAASSGLDGLDFSITLKSEADAASAALRAFKRNPFESTFTGARVHGDSTFPTTPRRAFALAGLDCVCTDNCFFCVFLLSAVCCLLSAVCCLLSAVCCLLSAVPHPVEAPTMCRNWVSEGPLAAALPLRMVYTCISCKLSHVCKACAVKCHSCHCVEVNLRDPATEPPRCDCGDSDVCVARTMEDLSTW